jgi:hypothetical protein
MTNVREETSVATGMHQWYEGPKFRGATMSEKGEDSRQEIAKQTVGNSTRLRKMNVRTLWRGRPLPKRKRRPLTG